jgi:hypothetical protein
MDSRGEEERIGLLKDKAEGERDNRSRTLRVALALAGGGGGTHAVPRYESAWCRVQGLGFRGSCLRLQIYGLGLGSMRA